MDSLDGTEHQELMVSTMSNIGRGSLILLYSKLWLSCSWWLCLIINSVLQTSHLPSVTWTMFWSPASPPCTIWNTYTQYLSILTCLYSPYSLRYVLLVDQTSLSSDTAWVQTASSSPAKVDGHHPQIPQPQHHTIPLYMFPGMVNYYYCFLLQATQLLWAFHCTCDWCPASSTMD